MKKRGRRIVLWMALGVALVPAIAIAGSPKPGGTYKAETNVGDRLTLKVNNTGTKYFIRLVDPCGKIGSGGGLNITRSGYFAVSAPDGTLVKGTYKSRQKAVGTIRTPSCSEAPGRRGFIAKLGG